MAKRKKVSISQAVTKEENNHPENDTAIEIETDIKTIRETTNELLQHLESFQRVAETGEPLDPKWVLTTLTPAAMKHVRVEK
jgi:hypothetical protein